MWGVTFYDPSQQHFQHLSLKVAHSLLTDLLQFKMRWRWSQYQPASPLFIRHQALARTILTWQGTTWEWHFLEWEDLWQATSVTAEPCGVSDFHPSKFRPFGSTSWKSVWIRSPLSWRDTDSSSGAGGALTVGRRGSRQMGFIFAAASGSMPYLYPDTHGFPEFSWSPLDLLMPTAFPSPIKCPKQLS